MFLKRGASPRKTISEEDELEITCTCAKSPANERLLWSHQRAGDASEGVIGTKMCVALVVRPVAWLMLSQEDCAPEERRPRK